MLYSPRSHGMRSCNFWRLMFNKILWLLPQVLIFFLVEKWISPTRPEIPEIGQKNIRNFRG
jgi:hypothetical protein